MLVLRNHSVSVSGHTSKLDEPTRQIRQLACGENILCPSEEHLLSISKDFGARIVPLCHIHVFEV